MTHLLSTQRIIRISLAGGLALGLATVAGCGIGKLDNSTSPVVAPAFKGKAMGGSADCPADPKSSCTPAGAYVGFRVVRGAAKPTAAPK